MTPALRETMILQTKCGIRNGFFDFSKEHILASVEGSLKRLQTDYVDVLLRSGHVFEVRVELERDDAGQWVWSASDGPEFPIMTGTACSVTIRIDSQRPISKVFNLE